MIYCFFLMLFQSEAQADLGESSEFQEAQAVLNETVLED